MYEEKICSLSSEGTTALRSSSSSRGRNVLSPVASCSDRDLQKNANEKNSPSPLFARCSALPKSPVSVFVAEAPSFQTGCARSPWGIVRGDIILEFCSWPSDWTCAARSSWSPSTGTRPTAGTCQNHIRRYTPPCCGERSRVSPGVYYRGETRICRYFKVLP